MSTKYDYLKKNRLLSNVIGQNVIGKKKLHFLCLILDQTFFVRFCNTIKNKSITT